MPRSTDSPLAARALLALALANARYWTSVAAPARRHLRLWESRARAIEDPELRALALSKLHAEGFNAEAAAVMATLAPRVHRARATEAIVALELLYDYLDGLTERPLADPLRDGERLYGAFMAAIDPAVTLPAGDPHASDVRIDAGIAPGTGGAESANGSREYPLRLAGTVRAALAALPSHAAVADVARRCADRAVQAQVRMHATPTLGAEQAGGWAREQAQGTTLAWREFLVGAAASVLTLHALIAAAADPHTTRRDAERIETAYLSICAVVTLLDGIVDQRLDAEAGQFGYIDFYEDPALLAQALATVARDAARAAGELRNGGHHLMMLAGTIAYWCSAPAARVHPAAPALARMRGELRALILPPLLVMHVWRAARRALPSRPALASVLSRVLLCVAAIALALAGAAAAARSLSVRDEGHLHYASDTATAILDEGALSGTVPGWARVDFTYNGSPNVRRALRSARRVGRSPGRPTAA
jgi:tetraprenyl-beta-curcumene synthase